MPRYLIHDRSFKINLRNGYLTLIQQEITSKKRRIKSFVVFSWYQTQY